MNDKAQEIRQANDIVDVISSYIPLSKKGKNYFGVCPFHDDTNPSMSVSKDKQIYKCFSCGASGNVITFVMDYEHVDFRQALSILAKKAGIDFKGSSVKTSNKYQKYYDMYDLALKLYQNNINSSLAKDALKYLESRKIDKSIIKHFKIGLSVGKNDLTNILTKKGYSTLEMENFGLGNGYNDLYYDRIMFPLFDTNNNVVGFSGRIYNTSSDSKYINTKETPIFKKGELLYNYYNAKDEARILKNVIVVEGFMDVIRLYSVGIKNVVALMGTALTKEQIILLKRLSNNIYLCLDGDSAGKKAMLSIGDELVKNGCNTFVIALEDLDPDEYILKHGKDKFMSLYENATVFNEYKMYHLRDGFDLSNIDDKSAYINSVLSEISKESDEIKQELMLQKLSSEFDMDINVLKNNLKKFLKYSKIETLNKKPVKEEKHDKYYKASLGILSVMLASYDKTKIYKRKLNYLPSKEARALANEIIYFYKYNDRLELADFITSLEEKKDLKNLLNEVIKNTFDEESNIEAFDDYVGVIREYNKNQEIKRLKKLMIEENDPIEKAKILEEIRLVKMGSEESD